MKYSGGFIRRADTAVGQVVRDRGFCLRCGTSQMLTAAHIERRRFHGTRWAPDAILCLCVPCHTWFDTERTESNVWLVDQIGQEAVDDIHQRSRMSMNDDPKVIMERITAKVES